MRKYANRSAIAQGQVYVDHVSAMTAEGLHSKSDIAAELAHRDICIADLEQRIVKLKAKLEKCQRDYQEHVAMVASKERPAYNEQQRRIDKLERQLAKTVKHLSDLLDLYDGGIAWGASQEARDWLDVVTQAADKEDER